VLEQLGARFPGWWRTESSIARKLASRFHFERRSLALNAITHAAHRAAHARENAALQDEKVVVYDAALLIENKLHEGMAGVILVVTRPQVQLHDDERDALTREQAQSRIDAQMPLDEKLKHAKWVIDNSGTLRRDARAGSEGWMQEVASVSGERTYFVTGYPGFIGKRWCGTLLKPIRPGEFFLLVQPKFLKEAAAMWRS